MKLPGRRTVTFRCRSLGLMALAALACSAASVATQNDLLQNDLSSFLPMAIGDLWAYEPPPGDDAVTGVMAFIVSSTEQTHLGGTALRCDQSNGNFTLQRRDNEGLWLVSEHFVGGSSIEYLEPLHYFPSTLSVGGTHRVDVEFRTVNLDRVTGHGTESLTVTRSPNATIETLAGVFEDTVVTTTNSSRTTSSGSSRGYTLTEWRAVGIGPVKIVGEYWEKDSSGPPTKTILVNLLLSGANVGGRTIEQTDF